MIRKHIFIAVLAVILSGLLFVFSVSGAVAQSQGIAVVVNDGAITSTDLNDRMRLVIRSAGLQETAEIQSKVAPQVLNGLIEEELKLQEAQRLEISISQAEIDAGFARVAQQNNFTAEQFKEILTRTGVDVSTIYRQIRSQVAWGKVVQDVIRPGVTVSEVDVQAAMDRYKDGLGKTEYRAAEIFLPFENPKDVRSVQQLANRLVSEIRAGKAPFPQVAQQFSKSAGAAKGGDLGWVQEGRIDKELERALKSMNEKEVSAPIRTVAGYHILLLIGKREINQENLPDAEQVKNNIGMQRLERKQHRYFLDLKANAFIESRV